MISLCFLLATADIETVSEALGHIIGKNLDELGLDFDIEAIAKGLRDEQEGIPAPLSVDACVDAIGELQEEKIVEVNESILKACEDYTLPPSNP
jgi:hypothetical protein